MEDKEYKININVSPPQIPAKIVNLMDKEIFRSNKKCVTIPGYTQKSTKKLVDMSQKEVELDIMLTEKIQKGAKFKEIWNEAVERNLIKSTESSPSKELKLKLELNPCEKEEK